MVRCSQGAPEQCTMRVTRLHCLAFFPGLCLSRDASVHGAAFFSAATQLLLGSSRHRGREEKREIALSCSPASVETSATLRARPGEWDNDLLPQNGHSRGFSSGLATIAIRCHTFFGEPRQTDVCMQPSPACRSA